MRMRSEFNNQLDENTIQFARIRDKKLKFCKLFYASYKGLVHCGGMEIFVDGIQSCNDFLSNVDVSETWKEYIKDSL